MKIYMHRMLAFASVASSWPGVELRVYSWFDKELVCMCLGAFFSLVYWLGTLMDLFCLGVMVHDFNFSGGRRISQFKASLVCTK